MSVKSYHKVPDVQLTCKHSGRDLEDQQDNENANGRRTVLNFDKRLLRILMLLRNIHHLKHPREDFSIAFLIELFDPEMPDKKKSKLIREIRRIGFNKLKSTFEKINLECESYLCESEDLFGIFKRNQFKRGMPQTDDDMLKQIIQFLHITLIHINILYKRKNIQLPEKLIAIKNEAFETIEPFIKRVEEVLNDRYIYLSSGKKEIKGPDSIRSDRPLKYSLYGSLRNFI